MLIRILRKEGIHANMNRSLPGFSVLTTMNSFIIIDWISHSISRFTSGCGDLANTIVHYYSLVQTVATLEGLQEATNYFSQNMFSGFLTAYPDTCSNSSLTAIIVEGPDLASRGFPFVADLRFLPRNIFLDQHSVLHPVTLALTLLPTGSVLG